MRRFNQWLGLELGTVHGCLEKLWCIKQHMRAIDCGGKYTRTKWKFNSQEASRSAHKLLRWYTLPSFISPIFAVNIIGLENQTTRINLTFFFPFFFYLWEVLQKRGTLREGAFTFHTYCKTSALDSVSVWQRWGSSAEQLSTQAATWQMRCEGTIRDVGGPVSADNCLTSSVSSVL